MKRPICPPTTWRCFICGKDGLLEPHEHGKGQLAKAIRRRMLQDWSVSHGRH